MKIKNYLLIFLLSLILFFIIGFRLGQKVEKQNQINSFILTPSPTLKIEYQDYKSKKYNLKLIYPKGFQIIESTKEALIEVKEK